MNAILVAAIVAFTSITSPLVLAHLTNKQRREEKREDWARQDLVAAQAAEAARLLLERQDAVAAQAAEAASLLLEANERVANTAAVTNGKLDVIHELVNSSLTGAKQAELVALRAQVVLMERVISLNEAAGVPPTDDEIAALEAVRSQANEAAVVVADRLKQQQMIDDKNQLSRDTEGPTD